MKLLYGDDSKRVFADGSSLLTIESDTLYLYCLRCGGIRMFHIFNENKEARSIVESLEMVPLCRCNSPKVRFARGQGKDPVQQVLANVFVGLGTCKQDRLGFISLEDARLMVEELASREEMSRTEQLL